ncbi:COX assembly mitochondrial protein 2 homolog [Pomacea canaliculata]|uniref:COX assembly mitochondrial protein 2 homolog n=1 Tax=Pomacea canaliculata TaxID=400727 RepID=UPI000D736E7D|nr:COX assembly mitochondrial protein 2 homolog [Pomacea canaliculata]XP_025114643.1 COX assembly mitochondrial protein 2 homolog [Pomacea canaliculata]
MHPDLSPHLHSPECNELIQALHNCHIENPFKKFWGHCNDIDRAMTRCLKKERMEKQKANARRAQIMKQKLLDGQRANLHSPAND